MGIIKFYVRYVWLNLTKGYQNHPDELEARQYENEKLNDLELKWLHDGVIDLSEMED
jgi:hypothetical protein